MPKNRRCRIGRTDLIIDCDYQSVRRNTIGRPGLAVMVKTALEDGLIDRAAALLAWRLVRSGGVCL